MAYIIFQYWIIAHMCLMSAGACSTEYPHKQSKTASGAAGYMWLWASLIYMVAGGQLIHPYKCTWGSL